MDKRIITVLAVVLLTASPFTAASAGLPVKVGVYNYEPLVQVENWKMAGICIDILEFIAQEEDWEIEYINGSWSQCLERVQNGEIDLLAAVPYSTEYEDVVDYCRESVLADWGQIYTHHDSDIQHITDLAGRNIAVYNGDSFTAALELELSSYQISANIMVVSTAPDVLAAVHDKTADAGLLSRTFGAVNRSGYNITEAPISFSPVEIGFAVPKGRSIGILQIIDRQLAALKQDPVSIYHESINRRLNVTTGAAIPAWVGWGLFIASGLLILLLTLSLILRSVIRLRTMELVKANRELKSEVAERKRAEAALVENQEKYRELVDNMDEGLVLVDAKKRVRFANPAAHRIFGVEADSLIGCSLADFNVPDLFETRRPFTRPLRQRLKTTVHEIEIMRPDGTRRFIVITASPRLDTDGRYAGFFGPIRDVTELRQAEGEHAQLEAQIRQSQKLESLGIMAGGIAHDFNNLLMGVLGYADLIEMDLPGDSPFSEHVLGIKTGARRASELCQQLLAYSGKGKFVIETLDISQVVQELAHLLEVSISKKIVIDYRLSPALPAIEADATQIRQVVMNLLTNAADAIDDKPGVVTIATGLVHCDHNYLQKAFHAEDLPTGSYVYLDVMDTGCGMHDEELNKIFDPFYTTKFTGRGLGLAAVLGIVRGHRGAIRINSRIGRGTTFRILVPCTECQPEADTRESVNVRDWRSSGMILLAEDEVSVRLVTKRMLRRLGFEVLTVGDGFEAVRLFEKHADELRLVMLDLTMPVMDGEEAFMEIRRIKSDIPIVIASGYSEHEVTARFTDKDLAGFIQKPYEFQTLSQRIQEVLGE